MNFIDRFSKSRQNIQLHENTPSGSRVVRFGLTDSYDEKDKTSPLVCSGDEMLIAVCKVWVISEPVLVALLGYDVA